MKLTLLVFAAALAAPVTGAAQSPDPTVFPAARIQDVYRLVLGRDALLLESIGAALKQKSVRDGAACPPWSTCALLPPSP